jgi:hypothetical protein
MAKKTTTAKTKQTSKRQVAQTGAKAKRPDIKHRDIEHPHAEPGADAGRGAPIEHYHGEPNRGKLTGDAGSLDEETLDRDAPYNRTYGTR